MTLLEIAIVVSILGVVLTGIAAVTESSRGAFRATVGPVDLETRGRRALSRVLHELVGVSVITMEDDDPADVDGASSFRFRRVTGLDADGNPTIGVWLRFAWERQPGAPNNNADDDGDGLIDEGQLVFTYDDGGASPKRAVIAKGVAELLEGETAAVGDDNNNGLSDEAGFVVRRENALLSIWITVQGVDTTGEQISRTVQTAVRLRNDV